MIGLPLSLTVEGPGEEGSSSGRLGEEGRRSTALHSLLFTHSLTLPLLLDSPLSNLADFSSTGSTHVAETASQERITAETTAGRGHCCSEFKRRYLTTSSKLTLFLVHVWDIHVR